jgi:hypothetical protein
MNARILTLRRPISHGLPIAAHSCRYASRSDSIDAQNFQGSQMHIVVIGWLWVILMVAVTSTSIVIGVMTFLFVGLGPCAILFWLMGGKGRRRRTKAETNDDDKSASAAASVADEGPNQPNRADTESDQGKLRE